MLRSPWPALVVGIVCTLFGACLLSLTDVWGVAVRMALLFAGQIAAWVGIVTRLRSAGMDAPHRLRSAGFVALGGGLFVVASFAVGPVWESGQFLLGVLAVVAFVGAGIVALAPPGRKAAVSVLVVLHFGGIVVAITSANPGPGRASWLANQVWFYVYRPYLQFVNLGEQYRFFSPDPPPAPLLWFHLRYQDGSGRWVKMPRREDSVSGLDFHRYVKLTESVRHSRTSPEPLFPSLDELFQERARAGVFVPLRPAVAIGVIAGAASPWTAATMLASGTVRPEPILTPATEPREQYLEPTPYALWLLGNFVRHVAREHSTSPGGKPLVRVQVYRGLHRLITPEELAAGMDPADETLFQPFYAGAFDPMTGHHTPDTRLVQFNRDGRVIGKSRDPLLYWLIPIVRDEPPDEPKPFQPFAPSPPTKPPRQPIVNYVRIHAGDVAGKEPGW